MSKQFFFIGKFEKKPIKKLSPHTHTHIGFIFNQAFRNPEFPECLEFM